MKDYKYSINKKCRCTQKECPILGNCVLCVQNHIEKGNHLPECMQEMVRSNIKSLASMVEFECNENRPNGNFWETYDKENLIKTSIERHELKSKKHNSQINITAKEPLSVSAKHLGAACYLKR